MDSSLIILENNITNGACAPVQELLARWGIVSAVYSREGACVSGSLRQSEGAEGSCEKCEEYLRQVLESMEEELALGDQLQQCVCPAGHIMLTVPLRRRRQMAGVLFCCLKELRYRRTESLQLGSGC